MKIDGNFEVLTVAETAGLFLDRLNRRVQSFADSVGDPVLEKVHDVFQILAEHPGHRLDGLQPAADGPSIPALEVFESPSRRLVSPEIPQAFFNRPSPSCPQSFFPQHRKLLSPALRKVFPRIQPQILCSGQIVPAFFPQLPMFLLPDHIDSLHHMRHQVIAIKNNLLFTLRHMLPDRSQIRVPDIRRNGLDFCLPPWRQQGKIAVQTFLPPVILDMLHSRTFQVVNQGQIVMPFPQRFFIYPHVFDRQPALPFPSSLHRPSHDLPGFVPTDPQHLPRALDAGLLQRQNDQPLKKRHKSRVLFRPADLHLFHPMSRTLHPGNPGMKKRLELARVQVPPSAFGRVVIHRKIDPTFRTRPTLPFLMDSPNVHPFLSDVQLDSVHSPRFLKPQNMTIK